MSEPRRIDLAFATAVDSDRPHGMRVRLQMADYDEDCYVISTEICSLVSDLDGREHQEVELDLDQLRWLRDRFNEILGEVPR